jgi:transcriptional regulator with XRE-family HTH domain
MSDDHLRNNLLERQMEMFRLAERDHNLPQITISRRSGIHPNTIGKWARGEALMTLESFVELAKHLPDELASIIVESSGKALHSMDSEAACFDKLADAALEYFNAHMRARHDESPGGPKIVFSEKVVLLEKARQLHAESGRTVHGGSAA